MRSQTNEDPWVNAVFATIVTAGALLALARIAAIAGAFLAQLWPAAVLICAATIGGICMVGAFHCLRDTPLRTDVSLKGIESEGFDDDGPIDPEPVKVQPAPAPQETPEQLRKLQIDLEDLLRTPLHRAEGLLPEEISFLQQHKYRPKEFVPLGEVRRQPFYIRECKPESLEHTFVVHSIAHKLKPCVGDLRTYVTQKPDIIFALKGKKYALEIETPLFLRKKHHRLVAKAKVNSKIYGRRWWIVTTRSAYARSFRRYGKVLTRNKIGLWLQKLIPE
jgi:hypothetical protein